MESLIGIGEGVDAQLDTALRSENWDCIVIGGGIRKPEAALQSFEYIVNLVHRYAPAAAIAFNTSPADAVEAAFRALGYLG